MNPHDDLHDDRLGPALGDSLRSRVDGDPATPPPFAGVERRARQITARRRLLAGAATGALALIVGFGIVALSDDGDDALRTANPPDTAPATMPATVAPTTPDTVVASTPITVATPPGSTAPSPTVGPQGLSEVTGAVTFIRDDREFVRIAADGTEEVLYVTEQPILAEAMLLENGSILVELHESPLDGAGPVLHIPRGRTTSVQIGDFSDLAGGAVVDGVAYAFVGDVPDWRNGVPGDDQMTGDLRKVTLEGTHPDIVFLEGAYGIEWAVFGVDVQADRYLVAGGSESGPFWQILDADGNDLGIETPTDDPAFGQFDSGIEAVEARLNDLGTGLWWIDQPVSNMVDDQWTWDGPVVLHSRLLDPEPMEGEMIEIDIAPLDGPLLLALDREGATFLVNVAWYDSTTDAVVPLSPILVETFADPVVTPLDLPPGHYAFDPRD